LAIAAFAKIGPNSSGFDNAQPRKATDAAKVWAAGSSSSYRWQALVIAEITSSKIARATSISSSWKLSTYRYSAGAVRPGAAGPGHHEVAGYC
jgi:hypothetical protein